MSRADETVADIDDIDPLPVEDAAEITSEVIEQVGRAVVGERQFFELLLTGVIARGHVQLEDVPGTVECPSLRRGSRHRCRCRWGWRPVPRWRATQPAERTAPLRGLRSETVESVSRFERPLPCAARYIPNY